MSESLSWNQDAEGLVLRYLRDPRPDLKDLVMVQYAGLVERIARRFAGIEPFEDLVQVGFIGLLNALSKFDPEAGVRFNTYATYLVGGEIKHYLRDRAQTIRQPAWLQELRHRVGRAAAMLQQELGRVPSEREIADSLGVSETAVREVVQTQEMLRLTSLDAGFGGDEESDSELEGLDTAAFCPEQLSVEDRLVLEGALKQLRELERQVLVLFHFESLNQTEIAAKLGISCNYVSHILRQSLAKLRKILSKEEEADRILRRSSGTGNYDLIDPVTGAYTEAYLHTRLTEELHRASGENLMVALVLVDFKGLDALARFYGEISVTDFMADAADFFKSNLRLLDTVSVWGESGFGIILPETGHKVALVRQRLIQRLIEWINGRYGANGSVQLELGQALAPKDGATVEMLIAAAKPHPVSQNVEEASRAA